VKFALHMGTLRGFGSGAVGRNVFRHLIGDAPEHEFSAWVPDAAEWRCLGDIPNCRVNRVAAGVGSKFWTENVSIRSELSRGDYDALFSLGDTSLPESPVPHLLMVQQAYLAYAPEEWGFEVPRGFRLKLALMEKYFQAGVRSVVRFTVQTNSMRRHLCQRWDIAPAQVEVVPSFVNVELSEDSEESSGAPYICYVASASPHKNFEVLPAMMAELAKSWPQLICRLSVEPGQMPGLVIAARRLGVLGQFEFLGRVDDVGALLGGARAFVMPSKLESFGLPYYESMAAGCPVVAADRDFAREACGDAALYADADAPQEFAAQVERLLNDVELADKLTKTGRERIEQQRWSWEKAAGCYLSLLEDLGGR
jgi:glycosyltransferase involved in cell wall biosynthesis